MYCHNSEQEIGQWQGSFDEQNPCRLVPEWSFHEMCVLVEDDLWKAYSAANVVTALGKPWEPIVGQSAEDLVNKVRECLGGNWIEPSILKPERPQRALGRLKLWNKNHINVLHTTSKLYDFEVQRGESHMSLRWVGLASPSVLPEFRDRVLALLD